MRIFVTGATGFVGTAVSRELKQAGHQVLGLAYSDAGAAKLQAAGVMVHRGSLQNLGSLQAGVREADAVIHAAFVHDFNNFLAACETEGRALQAMGEALKHTTKPIVVTSGTALLSTHGTEADSPMPKASPRVITEDSIHALASQGVNASALRLAPTVHDAGDHGFVPMLIALARSKGVSAYVGDGNNHWGAVHRGDAARLYRLAIEQPTRGAHWHAVGEQAISFKQIAEKIGQRLGVPVVSKSQEEAGPHFGFLGHFVGLDTQVSSKLTQERLSWHPNGPTLMQDLDGAGYFA